jgi:hypothetical protein
MISLTKLTIQYYPGLNESRPALFQTGCLALTTRVSSDVEKRRKADGEVPPSRLPTMHEAQVPEPRTRIAHPYAYKSSPAIPFAAFLEDGEEAPHPPHKDHGESHQSEVMSRGAGLKSMYQGLAKLGSSKTEAGGSPDGGKFETDHRVPRKAIVSVYLKDT